MTQTRLAPSLQIRPLLATSVVDPAARHVWTLCDQAGVELLRDIAQHREAALAAGERAMADHCTTTSNSTDSE